MESSRILYIMLVTIAAQFSALALAADPPPGAAGRVQAQVPDRAQLERRFESVGTLLENSSAARQIDASGATKALEQREQARATYAQARASFNAGELIKASELLSNASVMLFEAVRLAAPEAVTAKKRYADFARKLDSVKALLAAHHRIVSEKGHGEDARETTRQIEALLAEAERLAATDQIDAALEALDKAYLAAKASVSSMRMGDTLVRSLHFASKEDEYHYEVDRNDTHRMLIKVLLGDRPAVAQTGSNVRAFLENAGTLRGQAEAAASRGDFVQGIEFLEQSTRELVRAIRLSGVFIPG